MPKAVDDDDDRADDSDINNSNYLQSTVVHSSQPRISLTNSAILHSPKKPNSLHQSLVLLVIAV